MRKALPEDAEEIAELEMVLFPDNCLNAYTIHNELRYSSCWIVDGEQGLDGYLIARVDQDLVDILRVAVRAEQQREGLGYRLMRKALSLAPKAVLMVRKDNLPAMRLYRSLGFQISGELEQSWMLLTSGGS